MGNRVARLVKDFAAQVGSLGFGGADVGALIVGGAIAAGALARLANVGPCRQICEDVRDRGDQAGAEDDQHRTTLSDSTRRDENDRRGPQQVAAVVSREAACACEGGPPHRSVRTPQWAPTCIVVGGAGPSVVQEETRPGPTSLACGNDTFDDPRRAGVDGGGTIGPMSPSGASSMSTMTGA